MGLTRGVKRFWGIAAVAAVSILPVSAHAELDQWIQSEVPTATRLMLANVSRPGTAPGSVIAAPSSQPDYYYHWVRDGALTMDVIVKLYQKAQDPQQKAHYYQLLTDYVSFSRRNQLTPNRSGGPDGAGLGEPKFNLDGSAFQGDWGRPQSDGPALRAITLIRFAHTLLSEGKSNYVLTALYDGKLPSNSVIKNDLEYVAHHWMDPSFDLWEEVEGTHFFTRMVQRRALVDGAQLADELGDGAAAQYYREQASMIEQQLQRNWDPGRGIFVETIDRVAGLNKPSGLDSAVILGVLHGATSDGFLSPVNDRVISTAEKIRQAFQNLYSINQRKTDWDNQPMGTAIGRYPEDTYNGSSTRSQGNPWFLATLAYAEYYYRCANTWQKAGKIVITHTNAPFIQGLTTYDRGALAPGETIVPSDARFYAILRALRDSGDAELRRVHFHAGADGSLWEQFNRYTGNMQSAANLTWSYAAFLTAVEARN